MSADLPRTSWDAQTAPSAPQAMALVYATPFGWTGPAAQGGVPMHQTGGAYPVQRQAMYGNAPRLPETQQPPHPALAAPPMRGPLPTLLGSGRSQPSKAKATPTNRKGPGGRSQALSLDASIPTELAGTKRLGHSPAGGAGSFVEQMQAAAQQQQPPPPGLHGASPPGSATNSADLLAWTQMMRPQPSVGPPPGLEDQDSLQTVFDAQTRLQSLQGEGAPCQPVSQVRSHNLPYADVPCNMEGSGAQHSRPYGAPHSSPEHDAILSRIVDLSCSPAGREVVVELLDKASRPQRLAMVEQLRGSVLRLSMDEHGCWVIQKAIRVSPWEVQAQLLGELADDIPQCMESKHGNFVVQTCIENMPPEALAPVIAAVAQDVRHYATQKYGCRVVQRLLEHCPAWRMAAILEALVDAVLDLCRNPYGCYVLRCALERGRPDDKLRIFQAMRLNVVALSRNRLAGLVIEKCIEVAAEGEHAAALQEERQVFLASIFGHSFNPQVPSQASPLGQIAQTRFGRTILMKILEYARQGEERKMVHEALSAVLPSSRLNASS